MRNDFCEAPDEPIGTCMQHSGMSECPKWPGIYPAPCCWLSCSQLCGAACYHPFIGHGEQCPDYGGERSECSGTCQHTEHEQKRVASA